eukprot:697230-Prorocentrum_minimum.AAC.3
MRMKREPQNPNESEEHQRHLQGVLYSGTQGARTSKTRVFPTLRTPSRIPRGSRLLRGPRRSSYILAQSCRLESSTTCQSENQRKIVELFCGERLIKGLMSVWSPSGRLTHRGDEPRSVAVLLPR